MKNIPVNKIKFQFSSNNYSYFIIFDNNKLLIKRIEYYNKSIKEKFIIKIVDNEININIKPERKCILKEKDEIINNIINNIKNQSMIHGVFDIDKLEKIIKDSYINIIYSEGNIALSDNYKGNIDNLDLILLDVKQVIGNISHLDNDISLNVIECYKKDVLELYKKFLLLFKKDTKLIKVL